MLLYVRVVKGEEVEFTSWFIGLKRVILEGFRFKGIHLLRVV